MNESYQVLKNVYAPLSFNFCRTKCKPINSGSKLSFLFRKLFLINFKATNIIRQFFVKAFEEKVLWMFVWNILEEYIKIGIFLRKVVICLVFFSN